MNTNNKTPFSKIAFISIGIMVFSMHILAQEKWKHHTVWADIHESVEKLKTKFGLQPKEQAIIIDPSKQMLYLIEDTTIIEGYPISTSAVGIGSQSGSYKTPFGTHRIKTKFGNAAPLGTIFVARENTGSIAHIYTDTIDVPEDHVTTRIMWLDGQEKGINKGETIDSYQRYIYIHGTPEEGLIGRPASHGCIRMKNRDVIKLFDKVGIHTLVEIQNKEFVKGR